MSAPGGIRRSVPGRRWGLTWGVGLAVAAAVLIRIELDVRARGFRPSVTDDQQLWAIERGRASTGRRDAIVLLGDSRIQLGVATAELRRQLPGHRVVQLAVEHSTPGPALADLARDPDFRGLVVVGVVELTLSQGGESGLERYVAAYRRRWRAPGALVERWLATPLQARVTFLSATGRRTLDSLIQRRGWPPAIYIATQPDRSRLADYSLKDVESRRQRDAERLRARPIWKKGPAVWLRRAMSFEPSVEAIRARGGEVVFLRMPTGGAFRRWEEESYPRAEYWDRFAAATSARAIHFLDHPGLRDVPLPDDSHVDMRDAPRFTAALVDALRAEGAVR